ncbi:MAG: hypothetical protein ACI83P_001372 [Janthinobacterium sp.]|jgi:hypothetical protein
MIWISAGAAAACFQQKDGPLDAACNIFSVILTPD